MDISFDAGVGGGIIFDRNKNNHEPFAVVISRNGDSRRGGDDYKMISALMPCVLKV